MQPLRTCSIGKHYSSTFEADLHPIQIVRSVPRAESGAPEVATFLIKGVDHHKNDCIPVIADFVLCGEKINLNMSMGLRKVALNA